jgi:hypothetical protein
MPGAPTEIRSYARKWTEDALETLAEIMKDRNALPAPRVSAAIALLDRGWGKPDQQQTIVHHNELESLSDDELRKLIRRELEGGS